MSYWRSLIPIKERFMEKVAMEPNSGCWIWMGSLDQGAYSSFWNGKKLVRGHRWAYEQFVGPIPVGLVIDHKCRIRCCVNTQHMDVVTNYTNIMRGQTAAALRSKQTHCIRGHLLSGKNLYVNPRGARQCRTCQNKRSAMHKERRLSGEKTC